MISPRFPPLYKIAPIIQGEAWVERAGHPGSPVKVVCIAPGLDESYMEMGKSPRGLVVMIRTDENTSRTLK